MSKTREILARLVAFPTVCGQSNVAMIDWVEAQLRATGAHVRRFPGDRPDAFSLFASLGPETPDGLVLSAHSDVVPVVGQPWTHDPFTLTQDGDRLYGRGSSDMKGFLACMVTAAGRAASRPLRRPLHLAVSYDEELGCVGVRSLLSALRHEGVAAAGCVVGEPTDMNVAIAHKGKVAFRITCEGQAAHSANPFQGTNAIVLAAGMIGRLSALQEHLRSTEIHDTRFAVPFSTVQAGLIEGGTALNIVPDRCVVMAEMRLIPGQDGQAGLAWLEAAAREIVRGHDRAAIRIEVTNAYPGLDASAEGDLCALGLHEAGRNRPGVIDFGTEAGLFTQELGLPCIVCGPGSIARAHKADEYITVAELAEGDRFLDGIINNLCL
ncbi:acetylornithine deacetylase ArgE [Ameyamaea chiangmaiensis NBRC 103196]|uniref:Acetylornithine deacetylase n=1 Tax=Ameyamaea chiangmaiensis TaxID=442969 RepID=A0A850P9T2_9PROT|nr:acetylornithine deacetylase [Ameyamaea chiangmaiensis]MBS4076388.1 acetylornithine deacetylase [Ameyamaea chiangmaiensis]NVN40794.1 acetylornithine deacetylase [Ameyamaea chiangmaiensis]GBQ63478.1 acetylornithine deacetylase ArgE [Ameyamaea chiangmaiensis NBRC 103196]